MEKIKHLISSSLLAAMLFTMCGCDDDKNKTSKGTENSSVSNSAETASQAVSDTQSDEKRAIIRVLKLRKSSPKQKIPMK